MGKCCLGDRDLFTAIDFMARKYSDNPLVDFGIISKQNELLSNYHALIKHLGYFFATIHLSKLNELSKTDKKCSHLSEKGCNLFFEDRPIHCVIFTCKKFRASLPNKELVKLANITKEMQSIEYEVFKSYNVSFYLRFKAMMDCAICI